jgi:hypothetical protein
MRGVYQHCEEKHLHRYLAEFDFRENGAAAAMAIASVMVTAASFLTSTSS